MKTLEEIKKILEEHKDEIRENYKAEVIGIFGSYTRGRSNTFRLGRTFKLP